MSNKTAWKIVIICNIISLVCSILTICMLLSEGTNGNVPIEPPTTAINQQKASE